MSTSGFLPTSTALAEATPDSLSELFSRDPEWLANHPEDLDKIIAALRLQRERLMAAEAAGIKAPRPAKISEPIRPLPPGKELLV